MWRTRGDVKWRNRSYEIWLLFDYSLESTGLLNNSIICQSMQFIYYVPFLYGLNYLYWFLAGSSQGISLIDFDSSAPASSELETTGGASGVNDLS